MDLEGLEQHTRSKRPVGYVAPDPIHKPLYIISPIYNPLRWKNRWKNYERFAKHCHDSGAVLYTIEIAFGEREHAVEHMARDEWRAKCDFRDDMVQNHKWITIRTSQEIWHKEAAINIGVQSLPSDWNYVGWVDGDVDFLKPKWVGDTVHQLQHYKFLQMFSQAHDLNPDYEIMGAKPSFIEAYCNGELEKLVKGIGGEYPYYAGRPGLGAWSGLAWACTREAWDSVGGLMDFAITGAADWYMAWALIGQVEKYIPRGSHPRFVEAVMNWQDLAERHIRRNVGCMKGSVAHHWHGRKKDRKYVDRSRLLADLQFDPSKHLKKDWQGLPVLCDDGSDNYLKLRDGIMKWTRERNEDVNEE